MTEANWTCPHCGRVYDDIDGPPCPSDDCPSHDETFVAILYYNNEPCRVYGPFPTEDDACAFLNTRSDFDAATVHALRNPTETV